MPIDHFFESLAAHRGNKAIGVVLSGHHPDEYSTHAVPLRSTDIENGLLAASHVSVSVWRKPWPGIGVTT